MPYKYPDLKILKTAVKRIAAKFTGNNEGRTAP
jgi:hypothetical protein